jgi:hypothetical protein
VSERLWPEQIRNRLRQVAQFIRCIDCMTPTEYLPQAIAAVLAGNEEMMVITPSGELACREPLWHWRFYWLS